MAAMTLLRASLWIGLAVAGVGPAMGQRTFVDPMQGLSGLPAGVQADTVAAPETSVDEVLRDLASRSAVVFVGQVELIERSAGIVSVTFAVEQPVLGEAGERFTLKEWAGLWTGGRQRYHVGQRAMVFLHAANASGLGSPVDGTDGVVPVIVQGADEDPLVDVRLLQARVLRSVGSAIDGGGAGAMTLQQATQVVQAWNRTEKPVPVLVPLPVGARPLPVGNGGPMGPMEAFPERVK
jgi:hypothetical protein